MNQGKKIWFCRICQKEKEVKFLARVHVETHLKLEIPCADCEKKCITTETLMTHRRKKHRGASRGDIKIFCPSQMEPQLLSEIEDGRKELQKKATEPKECDDLLTKESTINSTKTVEKDNKVLKNNIATEEYKSPEKPSGHASSEVEVNLNYADRRLYFRTKITSVEALKTEISKNMETDRSNGMINLYCKICGARKQTNLRLHIATHLNISLPCAVCNNVFNSERTLTAHTLQHHGKDSSESQENVYSVSTKSEFPVDNLMSKKAKSQYLRTFVNKDTGEKVYRCNMCKVEDSSKPIMSMHVKKNHASKLRASGL